VDVAGDTAIVGAYLDDNVAHEAGSAYVFKDDGAGNWTQVAKLIASDASSRNWFGWSVAVSGNTAIVGSLQGNNYGDRAGAAYIFQDDGSGNWIEVAKLIPSDGIVGVGFGHSVTIAGDIAIVGALTDDAGQFSGAAFAFRRKASGDWVEFAKLTASDAASGDHFGNDIAIFENTALIGAWVDDNPGGVDAGSAYVFDVTVPEPSSIGLLATGIAAMFLFRLRA
jgi:hypothetical protein